MNFYVEGMYLPYLTLFPTPQGSSPPPPPFSLSFSPHHSLFLTLLPCSPLGVFLNIFLLWDSYRFYLKSCGESSCQAAIWAVNCGKAGWPWAWGRRCCPGGWGEESGSPTPAMFLNWALLEGSQCLLGASLGLLGALLGFLERGGHESTTSKYGFS